MKHKVPGFGPDLMKPNSQQLQSVSSPEEKAVKISQLLWNETLVTAKSSLFTHLGQKMICKYLTKSRSIKFSVPSLLLTCNSFYFMHFTTCQTLSIIHLCVLFGVCYIWQHLSLFWSCSLKYLEYSLSRQITTAALETTMITVKHNKCSSPSICVLTHISKTKHYNTYTDFRIYLQSNQTSTSNLQTDLGNSSWENKQTTRSI